MARFIAELPQKSQITDYISLGDMAKTFPESTVKSILDATGRSGIRHAVRVIRRPPPVFHAILLRGGDEVL